MFAAYFASLNENTEVFIIERNEKLGKKLYITGKGRCNLTNDCSYDEFISNIVTNPKFLFSALRAFTPQNTGEIFSEWGLPLKSERGNRVFPVSDKSSDVLKALSRALEKNGVKILFSEKVTRLTVENDEINEIFTDKARYTPDRVIIATGGASYPATGSTGDGYRFASETGHRIIPAVPALCPINLSSAVSADEKKFGYTALPKLQGLSLKNISAAVLDSAGKTIAEEFGEMLFTGSGISGPIILSLSSKINRLDLRKLRIIINLKPALDVKTLDLRLLREFAENTNRQIKNVFHALVPSSMVPVLSLLSGIDGEKPVNLISKDERSNIIKTLTGLAFEISDLGGMNEAIITSGGVDTKDINPGTMRSKKIHNLAFAGEIIDVDALTGGFNLQIAFSTGCLAGRHIID